MTVPTPETEGGSAGPGAGRARLGVAVKIGFGLLVLGFGGYYIASRWVGLTAALRQAQPGWVVGAVVLAAAGQWVAMSGFRVLLQAAAPDELPRLPVAKLYFVSQLGKYIPGSVWPILAVASMARRFGISRRAAATAGALSLVFSLVAGAVVGSVGTVLGSAADRPALFWLLAVPVLALLFVQPRIIVPVVDRLLSMLRRDPIDLGLTAPTVRRAVGWPALSWILLGGQCWCLVCALGGDVWLSLAPALGGFALAYVAGTLFIPAPGGIGVRETVLTVALGGIVGADSAFGTDQIVVVVLMSRVLLALLDFAQTGVVTVAATRGERERSGRGKGAAN